MIIPSFSPGCFTTEISLKPGGRGSCWTVNFITWEIMMTVLGDWLFDDDDIDNFVRFLLDGQLHHLGHCDD